MTIALVIVWASAILSLSTSQTLAQSQRAPLLSTNPGFEDVNGSGSLNGWNYSNSDMVPTIVDVPPPADPPDPNLRPISSFLSMQSKLGRKMIRLDGAGGFGQYFFIGPQTTHLMMSAMAYAHRVSGSGEPAAIAQVTCYDSSWNELQRTHANIFCKRTEPSNTSGLLPLSSAVLVPNNTCIVLIAIWNWDPGVQVFADALGAVDMSPPQWNGTTYPSPELLVNPLPFRRTSPLQLGTEFWSADYDPAHLQSEVNSLPRDYGIFSWGSPTLQESVYQMVNVKGDTLYAITYRDDLYTTTQSLIGLDHYDVNWKYLGQSKYIGENNGISMNERVIRPPTGTAYSSFFFYVPSNAGFSRPLFSLKALGKYVTESDIVNGNND